MLLDFRVAPTLTIHEAFAGWLAEDGRKKGGKGGLSRLSISAYMQDANHFARWFERCQAAPFTFDLMTRPVVRQYFDWQDQQRAKPNSRNRRLASLRVLVRFGQEAGLLVDDPTDRIEHASEEAMPPRAKTTDEIKALNVVLNSGTHLRRHTQKYALLGQRDQVIWKLATEAGLRESEIASLPITAVDFKTRYITVTGKGQHTGHIKVSARLLELLKQWLAVRPAQGDTLVCGWSGESVSRTTIWRRIHDIGLAAGQDVSPHDGRHTFCLGVMRQALKGGLSPESALDVVRRQARHRDTRTTLRYLRATDNDLERVMDAL
jgi:site-specific recombinase XerD